MSWIRGASIDALNDGPVVLKHASRQIAIVKVGDRTFAIDNRCPHEGYPLAQGSVSKDCVLTCNWHNWKFRLSDGECLVGGDQVRVYPTRIDGDQVWVDLTPPPAAVVERRIMSGLRSAFQDRDFDRVCREIARLDFEGLDRLAAVRAALDWSHARLEFGTTHAAAAMVDWVTLANRWPDDRERRLIAMAEAVDHLAFDALGHRVHPYADAGEPYHPGRFADAIESEEIARAEGMVRRGLDDGFHWPDMEEAFLSAALAHYNSFGHSLIYVLKTGQAIELLGPTVEAALLPALARHLGYATREDRIPEFRGYAPALDALPEPVLDGPANSRPPLRFPATLPEAFRWLDQSIGVFPVGQVYDSLLEALCLNLLHCDQSFDSAFDRPVSQNVGWLDFTHGITFANAARRMCARYPRYWRPALAQMACFLGRNRAFIDERVDTEPWRVDDPEPFFAGVMEHLLDHGLRDPIHSAHHLKTSIAVEDEHASASPSCRRALLDGLNRFLRSPIKMKHVRRHARQALRLVGRDYEN